MPNETTTVLRTEKLAKTYVLGFFRKKVRAIRDVTLEVHPGEIFGLLGPNGAGKTTTLKVLMGLIKPTSGHAEVFGQPAGAIAAKRRLGYLPESPYFYDYLTGRELLVLVGQLFGLTRRESRRRAGELLERVALESSADMAMRRYSKGMLQRVGVAQALINDPELVILDEPLSGLDPIGRKQLRELIAELRDQGKTVVLSSHILSDVELLAQRAAILVEGRTVDSGRLDKLVAARVLSTEILVAAPPTALCETLRGAGHRLQTIGDTVRVDVSQVEAVDSVVDLVRTHSATILSINPRKESLEDVVVREATRKSAETAPAAPQESA